jgi:acetyltransferase-like isoleucine patch superfamily enzyme
MASLQGFFDRLKTIYVNRRLRNVSDTHPTATFLSSATITNKVSKASIKIGKHSVIGAEVLNYPDGGSIQIGDYCFIGRSTKIWAGENITIGNRVLISHGVNIHDSNSHSLSAKERHIHFVEILLKSNTELGNVSKKAIVIEDDVWIGFNVIIMKGVHIGRGAVIAAGTVVTKDVDAFSVVGGHAARFLANSLE